MSRSINNLFYYYYVCIIYAVVCTYMVAKCTSMNVVDDYDDSSFPLGHEIVFPIITRFSFRTSSKCTKMTLNFKTTLLMKHYLWCSLNLFLERKQYVNL